MTAVLAASMLAIGVVVGAAIGPAPSPSLAVGQLLPLLPGLLRDGERTSAPAVQSPAITAQPTSRARTGRVRRHHKKHKAAEAATSSETATSTETSTPSTGAPRSTTKPKKAASLPPITKVWLIELGNSDFGELATHASAAPYLDSTALPAGTLVSGWSALEASAFANAATLTASSPPQLLNTIVQPPCPEGAAGTQCAPDTPGALTAADEFLKATLPTITSTAAYRENGLVVITFASITQPTASSLPAGAANATLTSQPPTGALLISPFVAEDAKSAVTFSATSPKQSLEHLLRR